MGVKLIERPVAAEKDGYVRHDSDALARAILDIYNVNTVRIYGSSEGYRMER